MSLDHFSIICVGSAKIYRPLPPAGVKWHSTSVVVNIPAELYLSFLLPSPSFSTSAMQPLPRFLDLSYDCLANCVALVDEETGPILRVCVENHFESVKIIRGERSQKRSKHRQSLLSRRSASLRMSLPPMPTPSSAKTSGFEDVEGGAAASLSE